MQTEPKLTARAKQKLATKKNIKEAAIHCYVTKGFGKTQIDDITKRAGVAHGTFYVHFKSKDQILDEALFDFNQGFVQELLLIWQKDQTGDPSVIIKEIISSFVTYWRDNKDFLSCMTETFSKRLSIENLRDGVNPPMIEYLSALLGEVAKELGHENPPLDLLIQGILSMWLRIGMQATFNENVNLQILEKTLHQMTLSSLEGVLPGIRDYRIDHQEMT